MSTEPTQSRRRAPECKETAKVLRGAEQASRVTIAIIIALVLPMIGVLIANQTNTVTEIYLSVVGLVFVIMSFLLLRQNSMTIKSARKRLCEIQSEMNMDIHSNHTSTGRLERNFYRVLHFFAAFAFVYMISFNYDGVDSCEHFPWQSCGYFRAECPTLDHCPCGVVGITSPEVIPVCPKRVSVSPENDE